MKIEKYGMDKDMLGSANKNKKEIWLPNCKRFIVFMDIMGFKNMVYNSSNEDLLFTMKKLSASIKQIDMDFKKIVEGKEIHSTLYENAVIKTVIFSDSILLISNDDSVISFAKIIRAVQYFFGSAIFHVIPIKGAMAYGMQTADLEDSLYFGKPIIEAWEFQNDLYMYGVVLHNSVEEYLDSHFHEINDIIGKDNIIKYETPFKKENISRYVINWLYHFNLPGRKYISRQVKNSIDQLFIFAPENVTRYVVNTEMFVRWIAYNLNLKYR
jgi:hypothetical protein